MKVSSEKLTGIISEYLVKVADVQAASKSLQALLMPEAIEEQPITKVNIITATYLKVDRDRSRVVLKSEQNNQRVEIPHNFEHVKSPSTATFDIAVAYLKENGFNILHYCDAGGKYHIITDTIKLIPHPHPNSF
jgi:hypothetical protein